MENLYSCIDSSDYFQRHRVYPSTGSGCIKFLVPFGEVTEAGAEGDGGLEAEVTFEGGGVGIGDGDVTRLHGDELFVGLEVVVMREDTGS